MKTKIYFYLCACVIFSLTLAACGKQGGPFVAEGVKDTYPRQYPAPEEK